jgi:hypothetical protein
VSAKPAAKPKPPLWCHCNECGHETLHKLLKLIRKSRDYDEDQYSISFGSNWRILQCCGCEEVTMSRVDWCSEDSPHFDPYVPTYFPPRVSRRKPSWLSQHPELEGYVEIFDEIYTALHADSRRLAMMGARAAIDMAIARMVGGDPLNFTAGLDALEAANRMTADDRQLIEAAFDAGSAAMHRGHRPDEDDVNTAIDIVERIVHAEVLKKKAKALADATPKRPARAPKAKQNNKVKAAP